MAGGEASDYGRALSQKVDRSTGEHFFSCSSVGEKCVAILVLSKLNKKGRQGVVLLKGDFSPVFMVVGWRLVNCIREIYCPEDIR